MKTRCHPLTRIAAGIASMFLLSWASHAATITVEIIDFSFRPASVTLNAGDTVTWVQRDPIAHNSASDTGLWNGPLLSLNQTFSRTFDTAGSFPYHCQPHPEMRGTIIVQAAANQLPSVNITSPATGATFTDGASITLEATAADPDGSIAQVEFFLGRTSLGAAASSPYRITVTLPIGSHNLTAHATDDQGGTASSSVVTVNVTAVNAPPSVSITSPSEGASFTAPASLTLEAQASDPDGAVATVDFFAGENLLGTASSSPFRLVLSDLGPGEHVLTARATDDQGATAVSDSVRITVTASPAAPSLSAPRRLPNGAFQFTVHGTAGRTYLVQASGDGQSWETIQTLPASADTFDVTDEQASNALIRLYRVAQQ